VLRSNDKRREKRRLRMKAVYDMRSSPNIIWVIKSRRTRWAGHVARKGEIRSVCRILVGET